MTCSESTAALACVPAAIPPAERATHFALARKLFTELAEQRIDLPEGFGFRFQADAFEAVARFVANERKCCPFINFDIQLGRDSGALWLRMTGPEGTRAVLQAELDLPVSCGCN
jgi:hypothetical protein